MNLQEKQDQVSVMNERFAGAMASFVVEYKGCTCEDLTGLRHKLRESGASMSVVKNTLAKRAVADTPAAGLDDMFSGPIAVVWSGEDPVSPAKALTDFAKDIEAFEVKGGVVDGAVVGTSEIKDLASMPSKEELLAKLLALINAPATQLLRTINAPAGNLVQLLAAWQRKKEEEQG